MTLGKRNLIGSGIIPLADDATELRPLDLRRWDHPFWVLRDILADSGIIGAWITRRDGIREFRTLAGGALLWCPKSKEMGFCGPDGAMAELGQAIVDAFNLAASLK